MSKSNINAKSCSLIEKLISLYDQTVTSKNNINDKCNGIGNVNLSPRLPYSWSYLKVHSHAHMSHLIPKLTYFYVPNQTSSLPLFDHLFHSPFIFISHKRTHTDIQNQINLHSLVIGKSLILNSWQRMMSSFWVYGLAHL